MSNLEEGKLKKDELEEAQSYEKEVLDNYLRTGSAHKKLEELDSSELENLQKDLLTKRANLSAELTEVESVLRSISEALFEKSKTTK